ncbi:MAG TPA: diguanylate cyclase [Tepidisphaeraceae bacterium]|nr:diguanylate cyclase [Tepidisphaeraceae bacterium]
MNKQVLVVDDSTDIQKFIGAILSNAPVDMHSATDPNYGLTLAGSIKPDLILLDVDMPSMDGYEFCRRLKADPGLGTVPVLFLTAKDSTEQKVRGLELGAVDYITKPFSPSELRARVRAALRTQSVIQNLEDHSLVDSLTGLGNQKMFKTRMRAEASRRARSPQPLTCTYVDVDGFEQVNQYYGQPFGDEVLKKVAEALQQTYRPEDVICRLQADDFAVLLSDTTVTQAVKLAKEFKRTLATADFEYRGAKIAVTCGVAITTAAGSYDQSMLDAAIHGMEGIANRKSDGMWVQRPRTRESAKSAG